MDTALHSRLGLDADAARERALAVLDGVRRAGGRAALLWHNTYLADDRAPGYGRALGGPARRAGPRAGPRSARPGAPAAAPAGRALAGRAGRPPDLRPPAPRRAHLPQGGARGRGGRRRARGSAPRARRSARARRLAAGWRLAREARRRDADLYHVHDPELLPAALWLARVERAAGGLRRPRVPGPDGPHQALAARAPCGAPSPSPPSASSGAARRRLAGVVTANEDLAARFAAAGARAVSVTNSPWSDAFPEPAPLPAAPVALYVGGLGPLRGLEVMRAAFPLVAVPGARLVLAGPGDPGDLPAGRRGLGAGGSLARCPRLLAAARVAWIPLQRHGNYDRAVPTKLVEAMAAGRPVVASDLGRMGAMVREAGCGLVVPPADVEAHAAALARLLSDGDEAARMGAAGRDGLRRGPGLRGPGARADLPLRRGARAVSRVLYVSQYFVSADQPGGRAPLAAHAGARARRPRGRAS